MAKTTLFKGVVYLSDEQYNKLVTDGVIEVGGQTITYDESMVYVTPKALPTDYYTKSEIDEKLSQTISKPLIAPTATEIVAVDNTNNQTMLAIGNGLSVENGTLKASGGSGNKSYRHCVTARTIHEKRITFEIITNFKTIFSNDTLRGYLYNCGNRSETTAYPINGYNITDKKIYISIYSTSETSGTPSYRYFKIDDFTEGTDNQNLWGFDYTSDTVTEL